MVAEILAGLALVNSAVKGIKSAIGTAKDVSQIADQIDDLFKGKEEVKQKVEEFKEETKEKVEEKKEEVKEAVEEKKEEVKDKVKEIKDKAKKIKLKDIIK